MKRTKGLKRMSDKMKAHKAEEDILAEKLIRECKGRCMICGKLAILAKNHTRDRMRFVMSCYSCHFPKGVHKYLDDWKLNELKGCDIIVKER